MVFGRYPRMIACICSVAAPPASAASARAAYDFNSIAEDGTTAAYNGKLLLPDFRVSFHDGRCH